MKHKIITVHNKLAWSNVRKPLFKYNPDEPAHTDDRRKRFLAILKNRYGYTFIKSADELELSNPGPKIEC